MDIKSLLLKGTLVDENGVEYVDLSSPSIRPGANNGILGVYVVDEETEMRPDLISVKFYGSAQYIDIVCKANNIFNPFSFQQGDVLVIPSVDNESAIFQKPGVPEKKDLRSKFTDVTRLSKKDQERVKRLIKKASEQTNGVVQPLPPNMLQPGEQSKTFVDGQIILGSNLNTRE